MSKSVQVGIAAIVVLYLALGFVRYSKEAAEQSEIAYNELERLFNGGELILGNAEEDDLFRTLLTYDKHWDYLEKLDADHDQIAFRPDRSQVYFLHQRRYTNAAPEKVCLSVVTVESGGWENHVSHAGYPHFLQLDTLDLHKDTLRIFGNIREDFDWEPDLNGSTVRAGEKVRFDLDVSEFRSMAIGLEQLGPPMDW